MTSGRVTVLILAMALVAIVAVVVTRSGSDEDESADRRPQTVEGTPLTAEEDPRPQPRDPTPAPAERVGLPENPDEVRGSDDFALIRPANFRRALAVLERERQQVEGVFDGLRLAPGRIDTTIVHPDDRRTNIQVRPDFEISFESTHDFPTRADFRKGGLSGREVDVLAPARLLREFDEQRPGSASQDVDYCVIGKDIIDFTVDISCYMRIRTPRPRSFLKEPGEPLRVIG